MTRDAWSGSDRRSRLPPNWSPEIRPAVLARDGHRCCWTTRGNRCDWTDPTGKTLEVDHIIVGDDHRLSNLQTLCGRRSPANHHGTKTAHDTRQRPPERRPPEPHPGIV